MLAQLAVSDIGTFDNGPLMEYLFICFDTVVSLV